MAVAHSQAARTLMRTTTTPVRPSMTTAALFDASSERLSIPMHQRDVDYRQAAWTRELRTMIPQQPLTMQVHAFTTCWVAWTLLQPIIFRLLRPNVAHQTVNILFKVAQLAKAHSTTTLMQQSCTVACTFRTAAPTRLLPILPHLQILMMAVVSTTYTDARMQERSTLIRMQMLAMAFVRMSPSDAWTQHLIALRLTPTPRAMDVARISLPAAWRRRR